ncbi:DUF2283 domain-containing protein [Bacillus sp. HSf4]|uniref:DUF2283 domain-containing protein n=2 Tax=Bacillaceae TaxID=186817 RepID=UPI002409D068|nr:DUF2283 domain-containing protein [Bacillus sp. HSf4]WFA05807.1 DUF2283 domain-containing protein [Bacillus sp. HSf4]
MMNILIAFDAEADMGYISLTEKQTAPVTTEDIGDSPLMADLDRDNRIIGIEFTGKAAPDVARLGSLTGRKRKLEVASLADRSIYRFRANGLKAVNMLQMNGIRFYFADDEFRHFIGFDIEREKSE